MTVPACGTVRFIWVDPRESWELLKAECFDWPVAGEEARGIAAAGRRGSAHLCGVKSGGGDFLMKEHGQS
jgi:hypothetical protein